MSLHLVFTEKALQACMKRLVTDDAMVVLGDGVYALASTNTFECRCYVLHEDLRARGVSTTEATITYDELVGLTEQHNPVVSWHD